MNVSRACIIISAGYVCVVRSGTAQDQAYHLPPNVCHGSKTSGSWRRSVKLFLGLRLYPKSGAYPLLGVTTIHIGNFWGPLKQTNKQTAPNGIRKSVHHLKDILSIWSRVYVTVYFGHATTSVWVITVFPNFCRYVQGPPYILDRFLITRHFWAI